MKSALHETREGSPVFQDNFGNEQRENFSETLLHLALDWIIYASVIGSLRFNKYKSKTARKFPKLFIDPFAIFDTQNSTNLRRTEKIREQIIMLQYFHTRYVTPSEIWTEI